VDRFEIRFTGVGGQGIVLASTILGHAAVIDGLEAAQTSSYGAETRGTLTWGHVVISDKPVAYPMAISYDALVALHQKGLNKELGLLKRNGILLIDSDLVKEVPDGNYKLYKIPATKLALENLGNKIFANMILLGFLIGITKIVSIKSAELAVRENLRAMIDKNVEALRFGFNLFHTH